MPPQLFREHQYICFDIGPKEPREDTLTTDSDYSSFTVKHFTGQALGQENILDSDFSTIDRVYPPAMEIADSMGEWLAIAERPTTFGRDFIVFADTFGYCPVFYAWLDESHFVISDSFHGVAAAMEQAGSQRTVNIPNYMSAITSRLPQFQNIFSDETMLEEVRVLRPDQFIHISNASGVTFVPRSKLGNSPQHDDYNSALRAGIDLSSNILESLSNLIDVERRITLSGGVDSRLVLALLAASGHQTAYKVFSMDPRAWTNKNSRKVIERDIALANLIRHDYQMDWWTPGSRSAVSIDFLESLSAYQSERSNLYYLFRPLKMLTSQDTATITLRGGGGEIISSTTGGQRLSERFAEDDTEQDPGRWLAVHLTKGTNLVPDLQETVRDYVETTYNKFKLEGVRETLDNHYFQSRNRAHFGHTRYSRTSNELAIHMLSNPYFLTASKIINFENRAEGQLVRDVFELSEPELLQYKFESEEWSRNLNNSTSEIRDAVSGTWSASYDASNAQSGKINFAHGREPKKDNKKDVNSEKAAENYVKLAFSLIEDLLPNDIRNSVARQHALTLSCIGQGRISLYQTVAKAASVLDGFFPQPASGARLVRQCTNKLDRPNKIQKVKANHRILRAYPSHDTPIFEQNPVLQVSATSISVDSNVTAEGNPDFQYAFYLIRNGKRVAQRWYEPEPHVEFDNVYGPGIYQGISHVRHAGRTKPTYYAKTNTIEM